MRVLVTLERTFGHPDNPRPTKESIVRAISAQLPKMLEKGEAPLEFWEVVAIDAT